ncbi:MAG: SUMF1/EgtB/PvdO family nonheme iron enzyme [Proteobacteria bacterium]|nr:SUMF1/EgtB/PvdO family nonheme iron enzyme [Pseudomonadota bacterium]
MGPFLVSPPYPPREPIARLHPPAYDQYSLATVVYLAITGELPFSGQTNEAILIAKARDALPRIDRKCLKAPLSKTAEKAIMRALSRKPEDRFDHCGDFAAAFGDGGATAESNLPWAKFAGAAAALALLVFAVTRFDWTMPAAPPIAPVSNPTNPEPEPEPAVIKTLISATPNSSPPIRVELGSRPEEIDRAISICKAGGGRGDECARSVFADERLRTVTLAAFDIDRNEVTNAKFAQFSAQTNHVSTAEQRGYSWDITRCHGCNWRHPRPSLDAQKHPRDPVVHVSWADALAYCEWRGARLPSEDEWEYTARGSERRSYPWGDDWDESRVRNLHATGIGLEPVGSHPDGATPEGILDLAGSVWEWTSTPSVSGERKIFKGGSWAEGNPAYLRSAAFSEDDPDYSSISLGFRCAKNLAPG